MSILIISNSSDPHADRVESFLHHQQVPTLRLNSDTYGSSAHVCFDPQSQIPYIYHQGHRYYTQQISAIWYRKPTHWRINVRSRPPAQLLRDTFKRNETLSALTQFSHWCECQNVPFLNRLTSINKADSKLTQLASASRLGFHIPDTLLSCDLESIRDFFNRHPQGVVSKPLKENTVYFGKLSQYYGTCQVEYSDIQSVSSGNTLTYPILLQEQIHKQFELRITVVGQNIFACKIDSQADPASIIDWKRVPPQNIPYSPYVLPNHVQAFCLELHKLFDLRYSAIDMAVNTLGDYIFFELNPNGQYLWIEDLAHLPISQAVAAELASCLGRDTYRNE